MAKTIDYEKLYTDKCKQYREDMDLRNNQVNKAHDKIKKLEDKVTLLERMNQHLTRVDAISCRLYKYGSILALAEAIYIIVFEVLNYYSIH